jgi:superoxide dismutase, Cu-Zn family
VGAVLDWQNCENMLEDKEAYRDWLDALANPTRYAVSTIASSDGSVTGTVRLTQKRGEPTRIVADIAGLEITAVGTDNEGQHGFHIHTYSAELSCGEAGGHYNPFGVTHGAPDDDVRHVGDLGNITAVADHGSTRAQLDITSEQVTLFGDDSVLGRGFIIHASFDDLTVGTGLPSYSGNAGSRVACGTIGLTAEPMTY